MLKLRTSITRVARPAELLLAVVFLAGALLKADEVNRFTVQISYYGVLAKPGYLAAAALGTLFVETGLGVALLIGLRLRGLVHAAVLALLIVFTGLIAYGWAFHGLRDCGCFGRIEMSPGISIAKNAVLAILTVLAWIGDHFKPRTSARVGRLFAQLAVAVVCSCLVVLFAYHRLEAAVSNDRPFAPYVFDLDGVHYDLGTGEYLVAMLSMTCDHCMDSVPAINELAQNPDVPTVIALCYEDKPGALDEFRAATAPEFPLYSLGDKELTFRSLGGQSNDSVTWDPPRFIFVKDGRQIRYWDETVPDAQEVVEARSSG